MSEAVSGQSLASVDPVALHTLRRHRRAYAESYTNAIPSWIWGVILSGMGLLLCGIFWVIEFGSEGSAQAALNNLTPWFIGVNGIILTLYVIYSLAKRRALQHLAALRKGLPWFFAPMEGPLGGRSSRTNTLEPTLRFLEVNGMGQVVADALRSLGLSHGERHRIEGVFEGRPVAVELVLGINALDTSIFSPEADQGGHAAGPRRGPHLIVFAAGAPRAPRAAGTMIGEFQYEAVGGGVMLFRPIGQSLPDPRAVLQAVRGLGAYEPPKPFPAPDPGVAPFRLKSSELALDFFLTALRDRDYARALLAVDELFGCNQKMELHPQLLARTMAAAHLQPLSWTAPSQHEWVRVGLKEGRKTERNFRLHGFRVNEVLTPHGTVQLRVQLVAWRAAWFVRFLRVESRFGVMAIGAKYDTD